MWNRPDARPGKAKNPDQWAVVDEKNRGSGIIGTVVESGLSREAAIAKLKEGKNLRVVQLRITLADGTNVMVNDIVPDKGNPFH